MLLNAQVGPTVNADGSNPVLRQTKTGELAVGDVHGRFYEQCYRGNIYTGGISNTALASTNAIATGVTSSATPVIGLYNPSTSSVNLVILQATIVISTAVASGVNPGGFMWVYSTGNTAVSTGSTPINTKTLVAAGSSAKFFAVSTALTGLTNSLAVLKACSIQPYNITGAATNVTGFIANPVDNVDGSIIVPPGGVVGIMNQLSTNAANPSVSVGIIWEEVAV